MALSAAIGSHAETIQGPDPGHPAHGRRRSRSHFSSPGDAHGIAGVVTQIRKEALIEAPSIPQLISRIKDALSLAEETVNTQLSRRKKIMDKTNPFMKEILRQ